MARSVVGFSGVLVGNVQRLPEQGAGSDFVAVQEQVDQRVVLSAGRSILKDPGHHVARIADGNRSSACMIASRKQRFLCANPASTSPSLLISGKPAMARSSLLLRITSFTSVHRPPRHLNNKSPRSPPYSPARQSTSNEAAIRFASASGGSPDSERADVGSLNIRRTSCIRPGRRHPKAGTPSPHRAASGVRKIGTSLLAGLKSR